MNKAELDISVIIGDDKRAIKIPTGSLVEDVIKVCGLNVSAQIVLRNKIPIPTDEPVLENDELRIIETFSGG